MAALGRPQPYRLQTSIPQVGLGPLVHKDGGRKAESQHLISLFFCTSILAGLPPHTFGALFLHFFCFCVFRSFFACFSLFFCIFFAFHSRHPQILVSQMLPGEVPRVCLSRPCHPPLASRVPAPPCPQPRPRSAPTQALPHLPRPRPRSATCPAAYRPSYQIKGMQTVVLSGLRIPTAVSIDLYQRTNRKDKKNQETKTEKERERKRARRSPRFLCCGSGSI